MRRWRKSIRALAIPVLLGALYSGPAAGQRSSAPAPATRAVFIDREGVIRWQDNKQEVALFGANYTLPSAADYRAAGYLKLDRKKLVDEDMAHFARMGWDAVRLALWGDWESSDRAGNLIANEWLDLADYLIARARARGIYILFSPIQTYNAGWPDALQDTTRRGFSRYFDRGKLGTDAAALSAQTNYLKQILQHVNPYTHTALKDEPAILFIEPVNEPWHHPEDLSGSVRYLNALVDAVRSTGCDKPIFWNVSQDFRIAQAIRQSRMQGVTFGWYPTGLNSGRELQGNYLRAVDGYDSMRIAPLRGLPRIVYEFDSPDLRTGYMYPAMTRTFRSVGTQFAAMFAYDMLGTASRNLGWQTHYLNLVYTPRKALSAVIAAEAMRRLPPVQSYGAYPENTKFGDFRVSYEENLSELVAADAFLYAGTTRRVPPQPERLEHIAGFGSSPLISYEGAGSYFLDKIRSGVWRLEVYPDAMPVNDAFEPPNAAKIVTRALHRSWPMEIRLPDLGTAFTVQTIAQAGTQTDKVTRAQEGRFAVTPGVYVLAEAGPVDRRTLPAYVGRVALEEFHAPAPDTMPVRVTLQAVPEYVRTRPIVISAQVVDTAPPDSVALSIRPAGRGFFRRYALHRVAGYLYRVEIPGDSLSEGPYEFAITVSRDDSAVTFPDGSGRRPWDWDYSGHSFWTMQVVRGETPLRLFRPAQDAARLAFSRIGDAIRQGLYRVVPSAVTGEPVFHLELPVRGGWSPDDYTASLVIKDRIEARGPDIAAAQSLRLRLRGIGPAQTLHVTLIERDGTSWSVAITTDSAWSDRTIPLSDFKPARGVMLPQGFPGEWNYWMPAAQGRGTDSDHLRIDAVERITFSLRKEAGAQPQPGQYGVEIESATLMFRRLASN